MNTLLDGSKMREKTFYKRFKKIVGVSFTWWIKRKTVVSSGGSEWYEWRDEYFVIGGTAYDPPKLFQITAQNQTRPKKMAMIIKTNDI